MGISHKVLPRMKTISILKKTNNLNLRNYGGLTAVPGTPDKPNNSNSLKVEFYFDTISPYTWPAFEVLCRYKNRWDMDIVWKPVFMGALVTSAGNPFVESLAGCPNKAQYMFKDLDSRVGKFFEIPLKTKEDPITHIGIIGSLAQQRFVTAVLQNYPEKTERVCRELWTRSWGPEDTTTHRPEDLLEVSKRAGLSGEEAEICIQSMKSAGIKEKLKETTEEAVEKGAIVSPTMLFTKGSHEEIIWGSDRFDMVAKLYGLQWSGPNPL